LNRDRPAEVRTPSQLRTVTFGELHYGRPEKGAEPRIGETTAVAHLVAKTKRMQPFEVVPNRFDLRCRRSLKELDVRMRGAARGFVKFAA
jgi:hypothetical protein